MKCPCCGGETKSIGLHQLPYLGLPGRQQRIVDALVRQYPRTVSLTRLAEIVWADDINGGPEDAQNTVSVHMVRIRPVLHMLGWHVGRPSGSHGVRLWAPGEWEGGQAAAAAA